MRNLTLTAILLSLTLSCGCSTGRALYQGYLGLKEKQAESQAKLVELEAKYGSLDTDLDGKVSAEEAAALAKKMAAQAIAGDTEAVDDLKQPGTWAAILLAIIGLIKGGAIVKRNVINPRPPAA